MAENETMDLQVLDLRGAVGMVVLARREDGTLKADIRGWGIDVDEMTRQLLRMAASGALLHSDGPLVDDLLTTAAAELDDALADNPVAGDELVWKLLNSLQGDSQSRRVDDDE